METTPIDMSAINREQDLRFIDIHITGIPSSIQMAALNVEQLNIKELLFDASSPISLQRKTHASHFIREEDRQRTLGATLIINHLLQSHRLLERDMIYATEEKNHKPYFQNHPELHFNVSHSGKYAIGALAPFTIGVDIEKIIPYPKDVAKVCMTEKEFRALNNCDSSMMDQLFISSWCVKEAILKAVGTGLCEDTFPQLNFQGEKPQLDDMRYQGYEIATFHLENYEGALAYQLDIHQ